MYSLENLFANSTHKKSIFTQDEINFIEQNIYLKNGKPYIKCLIRGKEIQIKPEEIVRQLFIYRLIKTYGYNPTQIKLEVPVKMGSDSSKRADIVIFAEDNPTAEYIIVEVKKPKLSEGKGQLKSYCNATGATIGVWTNGEEISFYHRKDPNFFESISDIPKSTQKLEDILREQKTISYLIENDILQKGNKTLKKLIVELEDDVLANAGVNAFEEVFKLIYTKLYDEFESGRDKTRTLEFRNYYDDDSKLEKIIQELFQKAQNKWQGVFPAKSKINLNPSHLAVCVAALQDVKLFNSNLEVIDDAFEYLMNKSQKGEKGQFFTPRYVIDMCVKMLNPKKFETMIDTAAGSCGFPMHTIFYVWKNILREKNIQQSHLFTLEKKPPECEDYVNEKVFAIDFDEEAVRVARTLNLIAGDGKTNVLHLNTLDYNSWNSTAQKTDWLKKYSVGWWKFIDFREVEDDNSNFNFDIVMANPPFAGDIKENRIISKYELGKNSKGKYQSKVGRDILFIERNLQFLKPGGRMAVILPQGRFNNSSDKYIRDFIAERCRILAVVGLHGNVFKPHTGTKTSVLFVQKWDDELCPRRDDYPIFFATMQKPSKDNSGEKIYLPIKDSHGHFIVEHDLFNHDGLTHDGIAEAFIEFAKKESLSFFDSGSFDELKYNNLLRELECTEINFSWIVENNFDFRIDSEYFSKKFAEVDKVLAKLNCQKLSQVAKKISDGTHFTPNYIENGKKFLSAVNVQENYFDLDAGYKFISESEHKELFKRCNTEPDDVLIRKVGVGPRKACVVPNIGEEFSIFVSVALIKCKSINPYYLSTFINSKYGQVQLLRFNKGIGQPDLHLEDIARCLVPIFSKEFQEKISELVKLAHKFLNQSKEKYSLAEKILSSELGLEDFKPSTENIAVKSFSSSFGITGRLDAEFYQPKYDDTEKFLLSKSVGKVKDFFAQIKKICDRTEKFYNYVEIGDVNISCGVAESNLIATEDLPDNAKIMTKAGDILVSKVRPNRGAVSILRENNLLVSGAFTVLRAKNFSAEVLQVLLRLPIYKNFLLKFNVGTSYPVIKDEDILNLPLPVISEEVQEKISAQVEESFALRAESKKLLNEAKKLVEKEIEKI